MRLTATFVLLAATSLLAQNSQPSGDWDTWLNQGIQAFKNARYPEAIDDFRKAAEMNPTSVDAHLYLANACVGAYIAGISSPENLAYVERADAEFQQAQELNHAEFERVMELDRKNRPSSYYRPRAIPDPADRLRKLDPTGDWYTKPGVLYGNRNQKQAYYALAAIAWERSHPAITAARAQLSNPAVRRALKEKYESIIYDGISDLEKALELDPGYHDAMTYMSLLLRDRADLRDRPEDYTSDIAIADKWVQNALDTKSPKAQNGTSISAPGAETPEPIHVDGNVQDRNLIRKVAPVYPPGASQNGIQGTVRFTVTIGKDGRMVNVKLLMGHPLLVIAASDAVHQWVYTPTLLKGEPVEVVTQVDVVFSLP